MHDPAAASHSGTAPPARALSQRIDDGGIVCTLQGTCEGHRGDVIALTWADGGGTACPALMSLLECRHSSCFSPIPHRMQRGALLSAARGTTPFASGTRRRVQPSARFLTASKASMASTVPMFDEHAYSRRPILSSSASCSPRAWMARFARGSLPRMTRVRRAAHPSLRHQPPSPQRLLTPTSCSSAEELRLMKAARQAV